MKGERIKTKKKKYDMRGKQRGACSGCIQGDNKNEELLIGEGNNQDLPGGVHNEGMKTKIYWFV